MVTAAHRMMPPLEYVRLHDEAAQLDGVIAIHSTARGPAAGGCRLWSYPDASTAMADAFRLAEGMSYKNAMAELPFGGGKAVLRRPEGDFDRRALFEAFGAAVERLGGRYVTAEDVGTTVVDMEFVANKTRHVAGRTSRPGFAGGDPSPWTALGVFEAMKAAVKFRFGGSLSGMTVAVQGVGSVGGELCRLLSDAGASLVIADIDTAHCEALAAELGAVIALADAIFAADADVFAPCALGGALTEASVGAMKARLVCGAANNQLGDTRASGLLMERGIAYAPDYVVNAGGIINVSAEYLGETTKQVQERVKRIGPRTEAILREAAQRKLSPALVADRMAEDLMRKPVAEPASMPMS